MRLLSYGPRAVLVEFDTLSEVMSAAARWRREAWPEVVDVVPAARTVLVVHDGSFDPHVLTVSIPGPNTGPTGVESEQRGPLVEVPVHYDGPDLLEVASSIGRSVAEVVAVHSAPIYTVAFCGFMPGFSYLVGLDAALHLPRRPTPRQRVPAGSVAIAGEYTGIYPRESPGGWHLLGTTELAMWRDDRVPPATLPPGARVRFVPR